MKSRGCKQAELISSESAAPVASASMFVSAAPPVSGMRSPCPSPAPSRARQRTTRRKATISVVPDSDNDAASKNTSGNSHMLMPRSPSPAKHSPRGERRSVQPRQGSVLGPSRVVGGGFESKEQQSDPVRIRVQMPRSPAPQSKSSVEPQLGARTESRLGPATVATPPRQKRLLELQSTPATHLPASPAPQRSSAVSRTLSYTPGRLPATSLPARADST